jgi:hypothetical protein
LGLSQRVVWVAILFLHCLIRFTVLVACRVGRLHCCCIAGGGGGGVCMWVTRVCALYQCWERTHAYCQLLWRAKAANACMHNRPAN